MYQDKEVLQQQNVLAERLQRQQRIPTADLSCSSVPSNTSKMSFQQPVTNAGLLQQRAEYSQEFQSKTELYNRAVAFVAKNPTHPGLAEFRALQQTLQCEIQSAAKGYQQVQAQLDALDKEAASRLNFPSVRQCPCTCSATAETQNADLGQPTTPKHFSRGERVIVALRHAGSSFKAKGYITSDSGVLEDLNSVVVARIDLDCLPSGVDPTKVTTIDGDKSDLRTAPPRTRINGEHFAASICVSLFTKDYWRTWRLAPPRKSSAASTSTTSKSSAARMCPCSPFCTPLYIPVSEACAAATIHIAFAGSSR